MLFGLPYFMPNHIEYGHGEKGNDFYDAMERMAKLLEEKGY